MIENVRSAVVKRSIAVGFIATWIAFGAAVVACGDDGARPPATPSTATATAPADTAPTTAGADVAATPSSTGMSAGGANTADSTNATPAPTTTAPPPVQLPASFTAKEAAVFAQGDRLGDAVTASGGACPKLGAALNKAVSDPAFAKALKEYATEAMKLTPEQSDAARERFQAYQKKFDAMGEQIRACKADPSVKAATAKVEKIMKDTLAPIMNGMAGGGARTAPSTSSPAAPPPPPSR
jgi:hypothetical protein